MASAWTYDWLSSDWGACSKPCCGGTQTRTVTCMRNDGIARNDIFCNGIQKPSLEQECNTHTCDVTVVSSGDDWWLLRWYNPVTGAIGPTYYDCRHGRPGNLSCGAFSFKVSTNTMTDDGKYGKVISSSSGNIPIGSSTTYAFIHGWATHWMIGEWTIDFT